MSTPPIYLPGSVLPTLDTTDSFRWATVTATFPNPLRVRLDGDTTELPMTPDSLQEEAVAYPVGSRVWVQFHGRRVIVLGRANAPVSQELAASVNLDTITAPGLYVQSASAEATTALNYPVAVAGLLEVFSTPAPVGHIWQRFTPYGSFAGYFYIRTYYTFGGTWSGWQPYSATRFATGSYSGGSIAAATGVLVSVSLPAGRFTSTPRVVATPTNSSRLNVAVSGISSTGFDCRLDNFTTGSASARDFNWIAVQE